jgi:ribosomal-protein-alanine N-acetyltransferase
MNDAQIRLHFRPLDEANARAIVRWRYEPPYDMYNQGPGDAQETVQAFLDPRYHYFCISGDQGELVAFCCFGPDAQVPGGDYDGRALDIGLGVRPDLTGRGQGLAYVQAVLDFARATFAPSALRVTVAEFNRRALWVWERAGFYRVQTFSSIEGKPFVILARPL